MTHLLTDLADKCGTDKGTHQGFMKWYEKYLPDPDSPIVLCEFGVHTGASLRLWDRWFSHANTRIMGLDITLDNITEPLPERVEVYKVDCTKKDPANLLTAMRPLDVIIDDASHEGPDVIEAFMAWWPHLQPGGLYVVEDTHCSYDTDHYKWAGRPGKHLYTTMEFLKSLADDVNWGIHGYDRFHCTTTSVAYVHFYPGIAFIGKKEL